MDTGQQRNIAMNQAIEIAPLLSADTAGELLREMSFAEEHGCYTSFDLIPGFLPVDPFTLELSVRTALAGCFANSQDEVKDITAFRHDRSKMLIAWRWDGDGSLVFKTDDFMLSNTDCKKSYGWERHAKGDWVDTYKNYSDPELVRP